MRLIEPPLIGAAAIAARIDALAREINRDYAGVRVVVLAVLKGALPFAADLLRRLDGDAVLDFIRARSYDGCGSAGVVRLTFTPETDLTQQHVLLVEDILDTGKTAACLVEWVREQAPASLRVCALLDKPTRRQAAATADYVGFTIEDHFVVGYGLDYNECYRQLPAVYLLDTEERTGG